MASRVRLAVTGAAGWLGRELTSYVMTRSPEVDLLLLGRQRSDIQIYGQRFPVLTWTPSLLEEWQPTHIAHLAFVTRERGRGRSISEVEASNAELFLRFALAARIPSLTGALYVSSGAALQLEPDSYGQQKLRQEEKSHCLAKELGLNIGIARVWSVSGRFCTKPNEFLFYDLIRQALDPESNLIKVLSNKIIWRRYVDASQFLGACLDQLIRGKGGVWNSGGDLISNVQLAEKVRSLLAPEKHCFAPPLILGEEHYHTMSEDPDEVFYGTPIHRMNLEEQIFFSLPAIV